LAVQVCYRLGGVGHYHLVSHGGDRTTEMYAPRTGAVAEQLPFRQVLPGQAAAGV